MKKLEISISDDEWEQLRLAVTVDQKKIASDTETILKAEETMLNAVKSYAKNHLNKLNTSTLR